DGKSGSSSGRLVTRSTFRVSIRLCVPYFVLPSVPLRGLSSHWLTRAKIRITLAQACALGRQACPSLESRDHDLYELQRLYHLRVCAGLVFSRPGLRCLCSLVLPPSIPPKLPTDS